MAQFTTLLGGMLIILGVASYFATDGVSITALIPSFFGFIIGLIGASARNKNSLKQSIGIASILALVGLFATVDGVINLFIEISGQAISKTLMAFFCLLYLIIAANWFLNSKQHTA